MTSPQLTSDHLVRKSVGARHHAWIGAEVGELRNPSSAQARLDVQAFAASEVRSLLSHLHRDDGSLTVELRFLRDPGHSGLRAAVLCRVDGSAPDRVAAQALDALALMLRWELAAMSPLDEPHLLGWLYGMEVRPTWAWVVERRLLVSDASMRTNEWAFQPLQATTEGWNSLLDVMTGLPTSTVVGVRLQGLAGSAADLRLVDSLLATFERFAVPGWDEGAGTLGKEIVRPASPFAIDAATALRAMHQRWSARRFRLAVTVCGTGSAGSLQRMLEALVPCTPADSASGAFTSSPLHVLFVPEASLPAVDLHQQTLAFNDLHDPARSRAPASISQLAETVDETEASSLFHLPRAGSPPTPGFRKHVDPQTGIPRAPFVFISYNHVDETLAAELVLLLGEWSIPVWWDGMIGGGTEWHDELYSALGDGRCQAVVVPLTERTDLSQWVRREVSEAQRSGRRVIQVMLRPAPPLDSSFQFIDLSDWTGSRGDGRLQVLRRDIVALMS